MRRRNLFTLFLVVLLAGSAFAQFTTVTGTVTDPSGIPYAGGTISAVLVTSGTPKFTASNLPYTPPAQPVGMNSAGTFIMQLADNTALTPGGTQWNFTVCSGTGTVPPSFGKGPVCFGFGTNIALANITISGASQNISAQLNAVAPALTLGIGGGTITGATANGGLTVTGTTLGLLTSCGANQVLEFIAGVWTCASVAGVSGAGTTNNLPLWTGPSALGNSIATQSSNQISVGTSGTPSSGFNIFATGSPVTNTQVLWNLNGGSAVANWTGSTFSVAPNQACNGGSVPVFTFPAPTNSSTSCTGLFLQLSTSGAGTTNGSTTALEVDNFPNQTAHGLAIGILGRVPVGGSTTEARGIEGDAIGATNTPTNALRGVTGFASAGGTGTLPIAEGLTAQVKTLGAAITAAAGLHVLPPIITGGGSLAGYGGVTVDTQGTGFAIQTGTDPVNLLGNTQIKGPDPHIDVLTVGIVGDANISKNLNVTGTTVTIVGGTTRFASTDCQSGGGCTGAVNKVVAFNGGGPSGTITIAAPTPGANGQLISNINYRWQAVEIIDTGTLGTTGNTTNGWTLPTAEATVAEGANTSLAFPAASANVTNATGLRLYVASPWATGAANSGEEVLQVPGKIAFGTVTAGGAGCVGGGAITIGAPNQAGGIQATAHTTCGAGAITGVVIDITGSGYTSNPTATPVNGTGTVTVTVGLLCSAQSATNFRDSACDIGSTQTLNSVTMVGPLVPTIAGWRSVINAFTSITQVSIADTIPNNIGGNNNFAGWGTDNTANWNANVLTFGPCPNQNIGTVRTSGCHVIFPGVGSNGAGTGRYFFLNGLPVSTNGITIEGRGGRGAPPNGGIAISTQPTPSAEIVVLGDAYAVIVDKPGASVAGDQIVNLGAEDLVPGLSWGGFTVGGDFGVSLTGTHHELDRLTATNFVNGYGLQLTNVQRVNIYSPWLHAAVQFRFSDSVSATQVFGGMVTGNAATTGLAYGLWLSNNPIVAINQFGNVKFFGTQFIDGGYQGFRRISDSSYNVFYGIKQENISLTGGAACPGGGTACFGSGILTEGNTPSRCVNNVDNDTHSARTVNYLSETIPIAGGTGCQNTDINNAIVTQISGNFCAQTPCNLNDPLQDLKLGNGSQTALQASYVAGGWAFGPDVLSGASPAINCAKGNLHIFRSIGQNITPTFNSASCADGQEISFELCESGAGGPFSWTWPAAFAGSAAPINTAHSACTKQTFHWDATNAVAVRDTAGLATVVTSGTAYTNATTTFSNVVGGSGPTLQFDVAANQSYRITCDVVWQGSAATTGPKFQWTGPAAPTAVSADAFTSVTATTFNDAAATAFSSAMANAGTITTATNFKGTITLGLVNGVNAGTVVLQAAANGAGTLTIQPGATCFRSP